MIQEKQQELIEIINNYDAFATLLLTLPDKSLVKNIRNFAKNQELAESEGDKLMVQYALSCEGKADEDVIQELGVERVHLLRGLLESDPRPPYESRYAGVNAEDCNISIMESYLEAGIAPVVEVHEVPDQLGIQFNFLATLYRRAYDALTAGDEAACDRHMQMADKFFRQHPGRWALIFANEMYRSARIDFYRGVAAMLISWLKQEHSRISA